MASPLHGTMLKIDDLGVLLTGPPGIGKSQLALELLDRGHRLIGDDFVEATKNNDAIIISSPELNQRFIWIRYLGVINVKKIFGETCIINEQKLHLIIHLTPIEQFTMPTDPLKPDIHYKNILGIAIAKINFPSAKHNTLPVHIDTLCKNFQWLLKGNDASEEFRQMQQQLTAKDRNHDQQKNNSN